MTVLERFPTTRRRVVQLLALLGLGGSELARAARALAEEDVTRLLRVARPIRVRRDSGEST